MITSMGMSVTQIVFLALAALLVFWMVGAYNRLVRLRVKVGSAWRRLDQQLQRRHRALPALLQALHAPMANEQATLEALAQVAAQAQDAAQALSSAPVNAELAATYAAAQGRFDSALARLAALLEQQPDLQAQRDVQTPWRELRDVAARQAFARQAFNGAVQRYNDALLQPPTVLLTRIYRFKPAGLL